ncbi:MAG: DUF3761 domain-containing protein [Aquihabitans sp.]
MAIAVIGCLAIFGVGAAVGSQAGVGDDGPAATTTTLSPDDQAIVDGNVAKCNDLSYSDNASFGATCSSHDGVRKWLATYGRCADGQVIRISESAKCGDHGGFDELLPADFVPQPASGDLARCNDGLYSDNTDLGATCSSHKGVERWLARYGRCKDGEVIRMAKASSCDDHDGFDELLSTEYVPTAGKGDVARCNDGTYSDNTDFSATCSSHQGVKRWLAPYARCADGTAIRLAKAASCDDHDGFGKLLPKDWTPPTTTTTTTTAPPPITAATQPFVPPTTAPYVPPPTSPPTTAAPVPAGGGHTALCNDGTYSDAAHHHGACSHHGGVAEFYR